MKRVLQWISKSPNSPAYTLTPIYKLSPNYNGSNLLDSYELKAITRQLNRAIRASHGVWSPRSFYLKSPFHVNRLKQIYKESARKKISCPKTSGSEREITKESKGSRGFMQKLWQKVKRGLIGGKKFSSSRFQ
ncbi:hypothetical protein F511_02182 [Dorcoceras hygrometricum]|uniref:Uncharacterized protein n=1 Tax=Dorcoceras hygrometricum TaxID=472368 RepID=A0A2Z7ANB7_9LAMI|nr:hypothetical protein F511_02182 [Dorcoceras hygrometricum]